MLGSFNRIYDYTSDVIHEYDITNNLIVRTERIDNNLAAVFFTDSQNKRIPVPDNVELRNMDGTLIQFTRSNEFVITWVESYALYKDGKQVLTFSNDKQHVVRSDSMLGYKTYKDGIEFQNGKYVTIAGITTFMKRHFLMLQRINFDKIYYRHLLDRPEVCITIKDEKFHDDLYCLFDELVRLNVDLSAMQSNKWDYDNRQLWGWQEI